MSDAKTEKALAWRFEIACARVWENEKPVGWTNWEWRTTDYRPSEGEHIRNLTPLFAISDHDALKKEVERLNKWADSFSDAQLKERATAEAYQRELKARIAALEEGLKFYRDNWTMFAVGDEGDGVTDLGRLDGYEFEPKAALKEDGGERARALLNQTKEPKT